MKEREKEILNELKDLLIEGQEGTSDMRAHVEIGLQDKFANLRKQYEQHSHRISTASAIVAPFSLLLLQQDKISIEATLLLLAFAILLLNIIFIEIIPLLKLSKRDKPLWKVFTHFALGDTSFFFNKDKIARTENIDELIVLVDMQYDALQAFTLLSRDSDPSWQLTSTIYSFNQIKKFAKIYTAFFAIGILILILSIVLPMLCC